MMSKSPEGAAKTPYGIDTGRRRLLVEAVSLAGTLLAAKALSKTETANAAVKTAFNFRERMKRVNLVSSLSLDTQTTAQSISQGQPGSIQNTPTPDATVSALQKRMLQDQVHQLETPPSNWFETNIIPILGSAAGITTIGIGIWQYTKNQNNLREDRKIEERHRREDQDIDRKKRDEDRFQTIVSGLGSHDIAIRTGAAVLLRTFLDPEYKESYQRFYQQIFDLTVAHLRLREVKEESFEPDQFYKEIIKVFTQSIPLIVEKLREKENVDLESLLESKIKLGNSPIDIEWQFFEFVRQKFLDASEVHLEGADFTRDVLRRVADLKYIYLQGAFLNKASLFNADLSGADLLNADLRAVDFEGTNLREANLIEANLEGAYPEDADSLEGTIMYNVKGYDDPDRRQKCIEAGARKPA